MQGKITGGEANKIAWLGLVPTSGLNNWITGQVPKIVDMTPYSDSLSSDANPHTTSGDISSSDVSPLLSSRG